jgi:hypothetical protein
VDANSPSRGRVPKVQRVGKGNAGVLDHPRGGYGAVCTVSDRLFCRIRQTVACQAAPATLKSALLEPMSSHLGIELGTELFGCTDADFMALFTGMLSPNLDPCSLAFSAPS